MTNWRPLLLLVEKDVKKFESGLRIKFYKFVNDRYYMKELQRLFNEFKEVLEGVENHFSVKFNSCLYEVDRCEKNFDRYH